jgi:predicted permease
MVSAEFFALLNVRTILGRTFRPEEDRLGAPPVVVIGDALWERQFNASPNILGTTLNLGGVPRTVVGVVPSRLPFAEPLSIDVFVPINAWNDPVFRTRSVRMGTYAVARLKPGISLEQASADMDSIARDLATTYPDADKDTGITLVAMKEDTVGEVRKTLLVLMGAVGFLLLIACANVASLLLARSATRAREFAIRCALGAHRVRLIRQLLTESVLLAMVGGTIGLLIAKWSMSIILAQSRDVLPRTSEIRLDVPVLLFTLAASALTGILFGLAPAMKTQGKDLADVLKCGGLGSSHAHHRVLGTFVVVELALSIVLLTGAGLMIRSIAELWKVNLGFDRHNLLTFALSFSPAELATVPATRQALRDITANIESVPGIAAASGVAGALPGNGTARMPFWIEGKPKPNSQNDMGVGVWYAVQPGYLRAMGIPLLRGRFISPQDTEASHSVVVIDQNFARQYFPSEDPIGKQINTEDNGTLRYEIVGVVGHVKQTGPGDTERWDREGQFYFAIDQLSDRMVHLFTVLPIVARTVGAPLASVAAIRSASKRFDSSQILYLVRPMDQILSDSIADRHLMMELLCVFAVLALVLSALGVYGVISYLVSQRTREIGVRIALGAQRSHVLRLILGDGARLALFGVAVGTLTSLALTRLLSNMLFGVRTSDPLTLAIVILILTLVAFLACYLPAHRAVRVDPMVALRYE